MRHHSKRHGVSEIIGILLMLAIVVTLGVLVSAFATGGMNSLSGNYAVAIANAKTATAQEFKVEQVTFTIGSPNSGADVYVRNVGTVQTTLVSVYITDMTSNVFVSQTTVSMTVNVGTFVEISHLILSFTPTPGHSYQFTVTSSLGNSAIYEAEAG